MKQSNIFYACVFMLCGLAPQAWAEAPPVVDLSIEGASSQGAQADDNQSSAKPPPARRLYVEPVSEPESTPSIEKQQIANYMRMNLPQKIESLQQEVAELRGQLEIQAHELKVLKDQQQKYDQNTATSKTNTKPDDSPETQNKPSPVNKKEKLAEKKPEGEKVSFDSVKEEQKEQQAYNKAFNLIKDKKYNQAIDSLKAFLKAYPVKEDGSSQYALNAYYWLGELYFLQGESEQAAQQFKTVVKKFPGKPKVPDAMLKLGLISANLGKKAEAKQTFQAIKKRFPDSPAARLATLELQKL